MRKKFQVFVSSTFVDLEDERRAVIEAILDLGHIPVGMEAFQAGNEEQWSYIRKRIDEADYYVVIVAERYGSEKDGTSYTEMEYDYARATGTPVAAFLLHDDTRIAWRSEKAAFVDNVPKIDAFRAKCRGLLVRHWRSKEDLASFCVKTLSRYLSDEMPGGWIPAKDAAGPDVANELARLSRDKERLIHEVEELRKLTSLQAEGDGANVGPLVIDISVEEEQRMMVALDRADVPGIVDLIFQRARNHRASDIHIEPTEEYLLIRNRVDGILHEEFSLPSAMHPEIASRIKIISGMDVAEKRRPQDGRIGLIVHGDPIDVRVSTHPTIYGEKVVMRLLDKNALRPRPDDLGMQKHDLFKLYDKLNAPFGLVMISGPTGSGKTTTLYSCLGSIDKHAKNVLTVEDPVEYRLKGVHQMQVNDRIGLTFASGLRTILRQDPDVIMVGECRDNETAVMAVQASLTGHVVFSTILTNDAVGVVVRMLDMGVDHFRVANALSLVVAQRLVRRICPHCVHERKGIHIRRSLNDDGVSDERLERMGIVIEDREFYGHGRGCDHCHQTGYMGRHAVFEVFEMTNAARNLIMSPRFNAEELRLLAREEGMTTLIKHGLWMIEREQTTHSELIRVLGESY